MYYNPTTKEKKSLYELKKLLNASIPQGTEQIGDWYLLGNDTYPEYDSATHKVEQDSIAEKDGKWVQTYKVVELSEDELRMKADEVLQQAKMERANAVSSITVEVDGMVFDGDETAQDRMSRVASIAGDDELSTTLPWVLANNTVVEVTVAQIKEALRKALYAQAALWVKPYMPDTETPTTGAE